MKIKLNRALWNHKEGEIVEANNDHANWAIGKGLATMVEPSPENKMIEPIYKNKLDQFENKNKGGRPKKLK